MRGILKKLLCGVLVFLYAASFVMLAYTSVNAESVTEKSGNSVETDNDGDTENAEYGLSVDDYDFSEIDEIMKKYSYDRENTDFESLVKSIAESDYSQTGIINVVIKNFLAVFGENTDTVIKIIMLSLLSAGINFIIPSFNKKQVSDISEIMLYTGLVVIVSGFFYSSCVECVNAIDAGLKIYKAVIPAFLSAVTFMTGSVTSGVYYEMMLLMITVVNIIFKNVLLGLIKVDFMLIVADAFTKSERFSNICKFIPPVIKWTCRIVITLFSGAGWIKGMITPVKESAKKKAVYKVLKVLPGIGDSAETVSFTIFSAGSVIKNAIGIGGVILIISAVSLPVIKLLSFTVILKFTAAAVQPVADKKFANILDASGTVTGLMTLLVVMSACLFILFTAIVCTVTNNS